MQSIFYQAASRGHANHGWLDSFHSFSFANYYDSNRMGFGKLRVVNDDSVAGGQGFSTHPHNNMEIVSIPLFGSLEHRDSMGNHSVIEQGEIQLMSAGSGVLHSEFNHNHDKPVKFFQIWVEPDTRGVTPRYAQKRFDLVSNKNLLVEVITPEKRDGNLWLHQKTWFSMGVFANGHQFDYQLHQSGHGVFIMAIEGRFNVAGQTLERRDAIGISEFESISIQSCSEDAQILIIEIPM